MTQKSLVSDRSQTGKDNVFRPFANTPRKSPSGSVLHNSVPADKSRANVIDVLASSELSELPTSSGTEQQEGRSHSGFKRSRSASTADAPEDLCVIIGERPLKSPRSSPQPKTKSGFSKTPELPQHPPSSGLSSIQTTTPSLPSSSDTIVLAVPLCSDSFQQADSSVRAAVVSFGSYSNASSSQRVVVDGETVAVKNSDDDFSDDSLEELDDLLGRTKSPGKAPSSPPSSIRTSNRIFTRSAANQENISPGQRHRTARKVKFNLAALVERNRKENLAKQNAAAFLNDAQEIDEKSRERVQGEERNIDDLIEAHAPQDGREKFADALSRTEALHYDRHWYFFDHSKTTIPQASWENIIGALRTVSLPTLLPLLRNEKSFRAALTSGVLVTFAKTNTLPSSFAAVIAKLAIQDSRREVRAACLKILDHASWEQLPALSLIEDTIDLLGAHNHSAEKPCRLRMEAEVEQVSTKLRNLLDSVDNVLHFVKHIPHDWRDPDRERIFLLLLQLAADDSIQGDAAVKLTLSDALRTILADVIEYNKDLIEQINRLIPSDTLRLRALCAIPVTDPRSNLLRRRLASAWFLGEESLSEPVNEGCLDGVDRSFNESLVKFEQILIYFRNHPNIFSVTSKTDYYMLKTKIQFLTIAMGDGDFSLVNEREVAEPEADFNAGVDKIARAVRAIYGDIHDTGASHASRLEAKDALDSLHSKLLFSVRTRPPPRRDVVGEIYEKVRDADDRRMGQRSLHQFLLQGRKSEVGQGSSGGAVAAAQGNGTIAESLRPA